ncbi:response regulator transcription factor [Permianibacter sp. IMCC34836]|uniref:response regulator n=1 Tax=Permianibacter fluminis TaxID=2738515 RepID=UPI0015565207|nr:response regulator transcription factor [Permianibacter fluminis]NQD36921.1 response regulator transcription factor [Permianibacter fluminis]
MIRVMVVDDQHLVRQGICSLLQLSPKVEVLAEASNGQEALQWLDSHEVDVLLLDLRMPICDGLATLQALRAKQNPTPVLILTTFDDDELVLASIEAGARGYLLKDVTLESLISAIETVHGGEQLHQPVALKERARLATMAGATAGDGAPAEALSQREREILRLLSGGYSNKEIARALNLAEGTVKNHVSAILAKLGVRDRTRAVLKAVELQLI